jgi:hypothetical protein
MKFNDYSLLKALEHKYPGFIRVTSESFVILDEGNTITDPNLSQMQFPFPPNSQPMTTQTVQPQVPQPAPPDMSSQPETASGQNAPVIGQNATMTNQQSPQVTAKNTKTLRPDYQELLGVANKLQTPQLVKMFKQWLGNTFKRNGTNNQTQTMGAGGQGPQSMTTMAARQGNAPIMAAPQNFPSFNYQT